MLKGTVIEQVVREIVEIIADEFKKQSSPKHPQRRIEIPQKKDQDSLKPNPSVPRLIPVSKWNHHHEFPKIGGLRALIFNAEKNGFKRCVRRIGRSVLIHEEEFFKWVEDQNNA